MVIAFGMFKYPHMWTAIIEVRGILVHNILATTFSSLFGAFTGMKRFSGRSFSLCILQKSGTLTPQHVRSIFPHLFPSPSRRGVRGEVRRPP